MLQFEAQSAQAFTTQTRRQPHRLITSVQVQSDRQFALKKLVFHYFNTIKYFSNSTNS